MGFASLGVAGAKEVLNRLVDQPKTLQGKVFRNGIQSATEYAIEQIKQESLNNKPEYTWRVEKLMREGMDREKAEEQAIFQMLVERIG